MDSLLKIESLKKYYGKKPNQTKALDGISFQVMPGEFLGIMGSSGSGKSTLLNCIATVIKPDSGTIELQGKEIQALKGAKLAQYRGREIGYLFQNFELLDNLTGRENIMVPLSIHGVSEDESRNRLEKLSSYLEIDNVLDKFPSQMSGGQRQRVAMGRAIVRNPQVFLLDEPLSNLDAKLRAQMRTEISKIHKKLGTTFIYVTHDQTEAMTLGDRIVVMKDGIIQQIDTPQNLYERPGNKFVAGFLGSPQMNFIDGVLKKKNNGYCVQFAKKYELAVPAAKEDKKLANYVDKEVILGIRPEAIHDDEMFLSSATTGVIECDVDITEMMGAENFLYLDCQGTPLTARVDPRSTAKQGDKNLRVALDPNRMHLFDKETEETIIN